MTEPRIAVVIEDDQDARTLTELVLTQSGFQVVSAVDGPSGIEAVRRYDPVLTTLDVQMPGMDGFATAKRLREFSLTYLIMVTSMASEIDVISGFEAGADDYLVKPFRPRELRARADAMLRRMRLGTPATATGSTTPAAVPEAEPESWAAAAARELLGDPLQPVIATTLTPAPPAVVAHSAPVGRTAPAAPAAPVAPVDVPRVVSVPIVSSPGSEPVPTVLHGAGLTLDRATGRASYDGRTLELDAQEFDLLSSLLQTGRRVRSKADLVLALRGHSTSTHFVNEADKRRLDAHIASLRVKLGDDAVTPRVIETVRGVGYRLAS